MTVVKTIRTVVEAEVSDYLKDMQAAAKQTEKFEEAQTKGGEGAKKFGGAFSNLGNIVAGFVSAQLLYNAGRAVIQFGKDSIAAASDVEEMQSKFDVVFRNQAGMVEDELARMADAMGRSKYDLMGYAATFQDTFVPLGFARDQAAEMSVQLVQLAEDLGSFNNIDSEVVARDIQSAMVGNTETLRKYGVVAQETQIKAKAMEMGLWDGVGAMDAQTKAAAILQITLEGTTDAQGDAERTSGGFANQVRGLDAALKELKVRVGDTLLPIATDAVTGMAGMLQMTNDVANAHGVLTQALELGIVSQDRYNELQMSSTEFEAWRIMSLDDVSAAVKYHETMVNYANLELKDFQTRQEEAARAAEASQEPVEETALSYGRLADETERINSALSAYSTRALFEKLRDDMDPEVALRLGVQLGVIDDRVLALDAALPGLIEKFDANRDGLIDATEAGQGFYETIGNINRILDETPTDITVRFTFQSFGEIPTLSKEMIAEDGYAPRAAGGDVAAGRQYTVGEGGPETFIPAVDGVILNAQETRHAKGFGNVSNTFYIQSSDPQAVAAEVVRILDRQARMAEWAGV